MLNDAFLKAVIAVSHLLRDRHDQVLSPEERERGAFSIEMALLAAALVVIAGILIAILKTVVTAKANSIGG